MSDTQEIGQRYFQAWANRDSTTVRDLLAENFQFLMAGQPIGDRKQFLDAAAFPSQARPEMLAEAYSGDTGFQMYSAVNGGNNVVIVEVLTVQEGKITSSNLVTDMTAFQSFLNG